MNERPTMIGCPSCAGCLSLEEGPHGHRQFVCSIGHTFALWELYETKETELERAQWSNMVLLKHLQMILGMLLDDPAIPGGPDSTAIQRRLKEIVRQIEFVQQMIEHTCWLARQGVCPSGHEATSRQVPT